MTFVLDQQLDDATLEKKEAEFRQIVADGSKVEETLAELRKFFTGKSEKEAFAYRHSYWRWFVRLTWERLNTLSKEEFVSTISTQVPMALLLEIDVSKDTLRYFSVNAYSEEELAPLYIKVKDAFLSSGAILGSFQGKDMIVRDVVQDLIRIQKLGKNSLEYPQFLAKLQAAFFPKNDLLLQKYVLASPETVVDFFIGLVNFFRGVEPENIFYVLDFFVHPESYNELEDKSAEVVQREEKEETQESISVPTVVNNSPAKQAQREKVKIVNKQETKAPPVKKPTPASSPVKTIKPEMPQQKFSFKDIKRMIEARFTLNAKGEIEDSNGVVLLLEEFAKMHSNDRIRELYYFDVTEGKFKWNDDLLKS